MANVFTPNGSSCITVGKGNLPSFVGKKILFEMDNVTLANRVGTPYLFDFGNRFALQTNFTDGAMYLYVDGSPFNLGEYFELFGVADNNTDLVQKNLSILLEINGDYTITVGGNVTRTGTISRSSNGVEDHMRLGCQGTGNLVGSDNWRFLPSGNKFGDVKLTIDDVLTHHYIMPSDPTTVQFSGEISTIKANVRGSTENNFEGVQSGDVDTTKPVITLIGTSSLVIDQGSVYSDAGATASDDTDGDITSSVVTVNPVDTSTLGTYTVTYNVSDAAGNAADEVTRTVVVQEAQAVTPPTVAKMVKAPNSASSYIWGESSTGNRVTMGKIECPTRFTHARVFLHSEGACSGLKVAVAPTSQSSNDTPALSFNPHNDQNAEDLSLWQSGVMPDITSAMVDNSNQYDANYMATSVSEWFEVDAIPDANGKYHLLIRLQTESGTHTLVGDFSGNPAAMRMYTNSEGQPYYKMFLAVGSTAVTDAHDFSQIGNNPLVGGYTHLFSVEFGVDGVTEALDAPSVVALGDSITADATVNPNNAFNIWPLVGLGNAANTAGKEFFFTNQAKSGRSEKGAGYARDYLNLLANGVKFDWVICPAFTPNGGAPDTSNRVTEQKAWLDELVTETATQGASLILWEGIPNQGYQLNQDNLRKEINAYGQQLADQNAHVYYIEIGSQVNTDATPDRVQPQYSADDFHLNKDGNDVLASYAQTQFESIIFGTQVNQPPIANAGGNQSIAAGATCILDGTASIDGDGTIVSYLWEKVSGPTIALANANQAIASFIAPSETVAQTLVFRLTATDNNGATSTDTVTVTVSALEENGILSIMETLDFELVTQGNLVAYKGRANREVMQLKPSSTSGIVTAGGYLDVSKNGIVKVEIIADGKKISNENSDSIKIDGARILARLGDLDIPTSGRAITAPTFMIVLYVGSDTRGLVVASNATSGYKPLSYRVEDAA